MTIVSSITRMFKDGNLYPYLIYTTYIVYAILFLGLFFIDAYYVDVLKIITQTYIALTLMYYFNPYTSVKTLTPNIRKVIFSSAFVLLLNNINTLNRFFRDTTSNVVQLL